MLLDLDPPGGRILDSNVLVISYGFGIEEAYSMKQYIYNLGNGVWAFYCHSNINKLDGILRFRRPVGIVCDVGGWRPRPLLVQRVPAMGSGSRIWETSWNHFCCWGLKASAFAGSGFRQWVQALRSVHMEASLLNLGPWAFRVRAKSHKAKCLGFRLSIQFSCLGFSQVSKRPSSHAELSDADAWKG